MTGFLTLGFPSRVSSSSFHGNLTYFSTFSRIPMGTASTITSFCVKGGFWSDQRGASTVAEELHSSSERLTRVETDKNNSSNELYDRLYRVLEKLSRRRPAHDAPDIGCSPNQSTPIAYNMLMKAFAQVGELDEVLRLAQEMKESNCSPNVYCYNTVMNALLEANRLAEAEMLFREMVANGVTPTVSSYNILVKLYSFCLKKFNLGYEVIVMMMENGCSPDVITHSTLIRGLCLEGRIEEARRHLCWMLQEKFPIDAYVYTPIVQGYCSEKKFEEARQLIMYMENLGIISNSVTYNVLVRALCKSGSFDEVEKVLRESSLKHWQPDNFTFNIYIDGLCKSGRVKDAYEKLGMMLESGIRPDNITLNVLLRCLCQEFRYSEAICLLETSHELEWYPGIFGYNTVMSQLCKDGRWSTVLKLLVDLLKKGIAYETKTLNIVIDSLCIVGKVHQAVCLAENRGFVADVVTYNTLIHWLFQMGKTNEALHMFYNCMHVTKITPDFITHTIMVHGLCKGNKFWEAIEYFFHSLKDGSDLDVFLCLISKLLHHKRYKELHYLFDRMARESHCLSSTAVYQTIYSFCEKGFCHNMQKYGVSLVLDKMLCLIPIKNL